MKTERSDLEGENLGLMRGRFVAFLHRESTVSLPCILLWLGIQIKIMSRAREASIVWMRKTMGWGAWVFDSAVRAEREFVAVRYVVGWLFGRDAISSKQRKIALIVVILTIITIFRLLLTSATDGGKN